MDLQELLNIQQLEGLHLDVMFGAVPKRLVSDVSKKFTKRIRFTLILSHNYYSTNE
jgi:hypothetical protein